MKRTAARRLDDERGQQRLCLFSGLIAGGLLVGCSAPSVTGGDTKCKRLPRRRSEHADRGRLDDHWRTKRRADAACSLEITGTRLSVQTWCQTAGTQRQQDQGSAAPVGGSPRRIALHVGSRPGRTGTPRSARRAPRTRRACAPVTRPERFMKLTPVGTRIGNWRSSGRAASSGGSSTMRTVSEVGPTSASRARRHATFFTQSAPGKAAHDVALAVDVHRRDRRRAGLPDLRPGTVSTSGASCREMGRPSRIIAMNTLFIGLSHQGGRCVSSSAMFRA